MRLSIFILVGLLVGILISADSARACLSDPATGYDPIIIRQWRVGDFVGNMAIDYGPVDLYGQPHDPLDPLAQPANFPSNDLMAPVSDELGKLLSDGSTYSPLCEPMGEGFASFLLCESSSNGPKEKISEFGYDPFKYSRQCEKLDLGASDAPPAVVPEPTTMLLLLGGSLYTMRRAKSR